MEAAKAAYARGLADGRKEAANIPTGSIMLPGGRVVKVLGDLPMTVDECVIGRGADLYRNEGGGGGPEPDGTSKVYVQDNTSYPSAHWYLGAWFSTREAAAAAKGAKQ